MKKRDIILIVSILLAAAALFLVFKLTGPKASEEEGAGYVSITVNGREWTKLTLDGTEKEYLVRQSDGKLNKIQITEGNEVYVKESNCDNHDCVKQGTISPENVGDRPLGNLIICLPNSVSIEVHYGEEAEK